MKKSVRKKKILIAGAGITGITLAYLLKKKFDVTVYEQMWEVGGLCVQDTYYGYDINRYGPHIFYTNKPEVMDIIRKWGGLRPYTHKVLSFVRGKLVPYPINTETLKHFKDDKEALKEMMKPYHEKRWGKFKDKAPLPHVHPIKHGCGSHIMPKDNFFEHRWQGMPAIGYREWFKKALQGVEVVTQRPFVYNDMERDIRSPMPEYNVFDLYIVTGYPDRFFNGEYGNLEAVGSSFHNIYIPNKRKYYPVAVVNFPEKEIPYLRVAEYKTLYNQRGNGTVLQFEYPDYQLRFYPLNDEANQKIYAKYMKKKTKKKIIFAGRQGKYKYMNMSEAMEDAIEIAKRLMK